MTKEKLQQAKVSTPTILQMEATECGATSLSIILAYYGKYISAEEARIACNISRDGTKAINIVKAARHYGMDAFGANVDIDELNNVKVPFIAYWEFNHFLVVEGFNSKTVYLNDPATGPRKLGWEEFGKSYTGVVLEMAPGEKFEKEGAPERSTLSLLFAKIGNNYWPMAFIILTTIALIVPQIATAIFTKAFIDHLLIDNQRSLIPVVLLGLAFTTLAETAFSVLQFRALRRLQLKLSIVNSIQFLWHLLHLPIRYFQQRAAGDIAHRNSLNEELAIMLSKNLPAQVVGIFEMFAFGLVIFILSWQIGLALFLITSLNLVSMLVGRRFLLDQGRRYAQNKGKLDGIEANGFQIIETLKVAALESHFFNRWLAHYTEYLTTEQRLHWIGGLLGLIPNLLGFWANMIIICYGAYLVMAGVITIGSVVAIQALLSSFLKPLYDLISFYQQLNQVKGDIIRLDDVVNAPADAHFSNAPSLSQEPPPVPDNQLILQVNNLSFSFSPLDPPVLDNVSLELRAGERVAVVGQSGSGKSTLAKLICGVYQASAGNILLNGCPIDHLSRLAISKLLAQVDQNILFLPGTLRDNLSFWDKTLTDEKLYEALKAVEMDEIIRSRGGLDLTLNESGNNFSGGQRQRLEIARAILRQAPLLILDEATSAMDTVLERQIYHNLWAMNTSLLIIAHRLSAIRDCNRIYVLKEGQLVQTGTHEELLNQPGLYQELINQEME
ncbi:hypothetical protein Lbir_2245 [Legionella birminghamensis]|uniref:ABC-type bacteriocin/lantibiotic exporters, contain an N-terminal double-glycine peptidase domain n=1 Tax=Legionella birminghamensis TaxID=28083 RepID=A0A378I617_9GAMM|nr:cysteine peptidase family C39 domain-containing protein [Legionella birminghamensis]KTC68712.1 hypothetical protein Lbir_2245 [Legionella birminghamensis]STX30302.1 ABC-type bacteriocin/lantibiotic exporters, contain an N-terminal double-glycine peptidase domain [Legionella birminghamensis]